MTVRSLAEFLRSADDQVLADLLRARPELLNPVPVDLATLAARAAGAPAVARAMDRLDRWSLQVLEATCIPPHPTPDRVAGLLGEAPRAAVDAALDRLLAWALLWDDGEVVLPVTGVREVVGPYPCGLGPPAASLLGPLGPARLQALLDDLGLPQSGDPAVAVIAVAELLADPGWLSGQLAAAPEGARELLGRLTWGPPAGSVANADREVRSGDAASPVDWLLSRGLLVPADPSTVVLPREVALALRGGRAFEQVRPDPPAPAAATGIAAAAVDGRAESVAAAQAFTFVRLVDDLLAAWGLDPPGVLRAGGLGVRELRRAAALLDVEEWVAAVVVEVAYAAGLVGTSGAVDDEWLPTPAYDRWGTDPVEDRWAHLADAWLRTTRTPGLVGVRDHADARDRAPVALGPDLDRAMAPEVRGWVLRVLAEAGGPVPADVVEDAVAWYRPRRPRRLRRDLVGWTLREAELVGVTGTGALVPAARALVDEGLDAAAVRLQPLLPEPLDHVLLQADLTAVAPGPLVPELAHELALAADVESTGGATVYRFTDASVRRALDAGRTADDLHTFLARHTRTPVPQPLTYLVDDVARRHGRVRVGVAAAYVRCDDPTTLDELVAHPRVGELRLRRLAPTVVVAQAPPDLVLARLRDLGYTPAAESPDGAVVVRRPDARRTPARPRPPRLVADPSAPGETLVLAAVRALRAGDRAAQSSRGRSVVGPFGGEPRSGTVATLDLLRSALADGRSVWIGYVDGHGGVVERVVDPIRIEGGYLTAYDHRDETVHTFAVHRITGAAELADESAP
jgi:hypothetical protein